MFTPGTKNRSILCRLCCDSLYKKFHISFQMWKAYGIGTFSHVKFSFHIWNGSVFICKIPNSHVKWTGSKFHMWNVGIRNMYFTCEMENSHVEINFTYDIFISHIALKQVAWNIFHMWNYCEIFINEVCHRGGNRVDQLPGPQMSTKDYI